MRDVLPGAAAITAPPAEGLSDWFGGDVADAPAAEDAAIPDWLRDLQSEVGTVDEDEGPLADDQPDWLASLTADLPPDLPATPGAAPASAAQPDDADLPDWLRPTAQPEDPAWSAPAAEPAQPAEQGSSWKQMPVGATDWLRSLGREPDEEVLPPAQEQPAFSFEGGSPGDQDAPGEETGIPDWLRDISPDEVARDIGEVKPAASTPPVSPEVESSDWMVAGAASVADTARQRRDELSDAPGVPDWLRAISPDEVARDIASSETPASPPPSTGTELPDWLRPEEPTGTTAQQPAAPDEPGIANWLQDIAPDQMARDSTEAEERSARAPTEGLDWLQSESAGGGDELIPDWLRSEAFAPPESPSSPDVPGDVPSWLSAPTTEEPPAAPADTSGWFEAEEETATPAGAPAEGMPDWLRSVDEPPPALEGEETEASGAGEAGMAGAVPDWLRSFDEPPPMPDAGSPEPVAPADSELPPWLASDMSTNRSSGAAAAEDLPDWLRGDVPDMADEPPARMPDVVEKEDLPSWLTADSDVGASGAALPADADQADWWSLEAPGLSDVTPAPPAEDEAVPDWLRDEAPPSAEAASAEAMPDWLRSETSPAPEAASDDADIPDWLRGSAEPVTPAPVPVPIPPAPADERDLPPWIVDDHDDSLGPSGSAGALPAWLQGDDAAIEVPRIPPPASVPPPAPPAPEMPPVTPVTPEADQALPSWLQEERPPEEGPAWLEEPPVAAAPVLDKPRPPQDESSSFLGGADLPGWLRSSVSEPRVKSEDSRKVDWLSNLGAGEEEGELATVAAAAAPVTLPRPTFTRSPARIEAAALLQTLTLRPFPEAAPVLVPVPPARWRRIGVERVLYLLLALALLVGLFVPTVTSFLGSADPTAPAAVDLAGIVGGFSQDDVVLMAYEWDAQRISELRPLEQALTRHLIEQRVNFMVLSTDPQGTLLSFDLRDALQAGGYQGKGIDYLLMGYRPGGELALRTLVQPGFFQSVTTFSGDDASQSWLITNSGLKTIGDIALIVVMADQPQDVQGWIEQVHSQVPDVPMAFLLPFETAPVVQPYLRYPNVYQLVGRQGALDYEVARTGTTNVGAAIQASGQQHFAALVFVALVLIGGIASLLLQPKRRAESEA